MKGTIIFSILDIEDGWDAIEHAIMEYEFRDGAVPIFILVQDAEGRNSINDTLTHTGLLASLESKNIILNSIVVGQNAEGDAEGIAPAPRVLGLTSNGYYSIQ